MLTWSTHVFVTLLLERFWIKYMFLLSQMELWGNIFCCLPVFSRCILSVQFSDLCSSFLSFKIMLFANLQSIEWFRTKIQCISERLLRYEPCRRPRLSETGLFSVPGPRTKHREEQSRFKYLHQPPIKPQMS